jgi:hypothetical protein
MNRGPGAKLVLEPIFKAASIGCTVLAAKADEDENPPLLRVGWIGGNNWPDWRLCGGGGSFMDCGQSFAIAAQPAIRHHTPTNFDF